MFMKNNIKNLAFDTARFYSIGLPQQFCSKMLQQLCQKIYIFFVERQKLAAPVSINPSNATTSRPLTRIQFPTLAVQLMATLK